nr:acyltransferase family protein [uncultured Prevotella sp.]
MNKSISQTISFLRFPLIVGVIFIHTVFVLPEDLKGYECFKYMLGCFTAFSVPLFFIISSFLFFYDMKEFDMWKWFIKMKKRVRTLLIPYILWNLFYLLFMLIVQVSFPNIMGGSRKMIYNYSFLELIDSFWNFGGMYHGMPILYSFWFIRNLFILNLFAPVFYLLLKKIPVVFFIISLVLFILNPFDFIATNMDWVKSVLFYGIGVFCAVNAIDFTDLRKLSSPFVFFVIVSIILLPFVPDTMRFYWYQVLLVIGALTIPTIVRKGILNKKLRVNNFLASSSFFVYAFHLFIIIPFNRFWSTILPVNNWTASIMLVIVPFLVAFISVCVYYVLKENFPKFTELIIGGR